MVDDKKEHDNDYSALSDMFDNGDPAPSLEDLLKDHGIDLGSDVDLDAMQDFSLTDPKAKPKAREEREQSLDDFSDHLFDEHLFDEPEHIEIPPPIRQPEPRQAAPRQPAEEDMDMFEVSDFDEVNPHFEAEKSDETMNDDDALFDYDPHTETSFADMGGAEPETDQLGGGGDDIGGGASMPPSAEKGAGAKRLFARLGMMLVLVSMIYGGLKLFLGEKTPSKEAVAQAPAVVAHPPSKIAQIPASSTATPASTPTETETKTVPEAAAATPAVAAESTAAASTTPSTAAPAMASVPSNLPVPGALVTPSSATASPSEHAALMQAAVASPQTTMDVAVPMAAMTSPAMPASTSSASSNPTTTVNATPGTMTLGHGDVGQKLDNLEQALQSIDQRLSQVSAGGMGDEKLQRLERLVNDTNAPEMHDVLQQAVKKMKELDRKLERISELQQQVRKLDSDVKMLKEDIVTQTNVVGQQQRLINDNMQLSQMQEPGPVKMMVQAAIPGRAWLRSERGELLTVIPGDEVPGYGRVVSIDAASGTVVTSSRAVFREQ